MRSLLATFLISSAGLAAALPAAAQTDEARRLDRMEKDVREIRAIVFQGRDTGQPVVVKPEGPDPAVEALQGRVDQLEQSITTLRGQVEVLTHEIDEVKRQDAAAHDDATELRGEVKALTDQLGRAPVPDNQAPPPPAPAANPAPSEGAASNPAAQGEGAVFRAAKAQLSSGDYAGAGASLNAYLQQYGSSVHAREANYLLGESYYVRALYGDATTAYARALRDWPKTAWAPDATVKLARALAATNRSPQACAALSEFDQRYGATATKAVKARAAATAATARCGG